MMKAQFQVFCLQSFCRFKEVHKQFETTPERQLLLAGQKDARHSALLGLSQNMQFVRRNCAFIDGIANLIHF
jgi:hypothetical protein